MSSHFQLRERCPACHGEALRTVFSRSYRDPALRATLEGFYGEALRRDYQLLIGVNFTLQLCETCGLIFQQQVPDEFLLGRLYEEWIDAGTAFDQFVRTVDAGKRLQMARAIYLGLGLVRDGQQPPQTLDVGCGWGEWSLMARAFGAEAWGTELSAARREYCARCGIRVTGESDLPEGHFDLINLDQVFEHLPHPRATLETLTAKLRVGGVARIAVPNGAGILRQLRRFDQELRRPQGGGLYAVAPLQHLNCFTNASLVRLAATCGLTRLRPAWRLLIPTIQCAGGPKQRVKGVLRPFYLRSTFSTDLYFVKSGATAPAARPHSNP